MTTNFANSVAWANAWAMTLLLMQPPSPPALGVYTGADGRRSAAGTWGWIGDGSQHAETITQP